MDKCIYNEFILGFDLSSTHISCVFNMYCFYLDRTVKRVCIVFRGSVSLRDWLIDGLGLIKRSEPDVVKKITKQKGVKFHGGFSSKYYY